MLSRFLLLLPRGRERERELSCVPCRNSSRCFLTEKRERERRGAAEVTEMSKMAEEKATVAGGAAGVADAAQQQQLAAGEAAAAARVRPVETLLRAAPLGLCVAAMAVMLKNQQSNEYGTVAYSDLGGFKYLVYANGLCAAYSLVTAFYTAVPRPATVSRSWIVFLLDQVVTYLILAAGAAAAELLYLAYNGDKEVTWSEACGVFGSFCRQARTSVAITFGSVLCFIFLSLISSYRLFSAYEAPPSSALGNKGVEIAAYPR